jgi:hypothetical protein
MQPSREGAVCRVRPELGKDRDARELADAEVALQRQAVSLAKERSSASSGASFSPLMWVDQRQGGRDHGARGIGQVEPGELGAARGR